MVRSDAGVPYRSTRLLNYNTKIRPCKAFLPLIKDKSAMLYVTWHGGDLYLKVGTCHRRAPSYRRSSLYVIPYDHSLPPRLLPAH